MLTRTNKKTFYKAILAKNTEFDGVFFVGVITTGVFCRPTCRARKPKFEHCEFFRTAQEAILASYRPCKRCRPLADPEHISPVVRKLIDAVEKNPEKRWKDKDIENFSVHAATVRRQFKQRFGMTFVAYARAHRLGLAMQQIRAGNKVIAAQLSAGYESSSGFRDAFSRIMGAPPTSSKNAILKAEWLDTPLGPMIAIADEEALFLLEFVDRRGLEKEVQKLRQKTKAAIVPGRSQPLKSIRKELDLYFAGKLTTFKTPLHLHGSPFQKNVWEKLTLIPYGKTCSYADLAKAVKKPTAYRAVANANGANQFCIIIPCHRVINTGGKLGGYGGGLSRKTWLINHEKENRSHS